MLNCASSCYSTLWFELTFVYVAIFGVATSQNQRRMRVNQLLIELMPLERLRKVYIYILVDDIQPVVMSRLSCIRDHIYFRD